MVNCKHHFVCVASAITVSDPGLRKLDLLMKLNLLGENPLLFESHTKHQKIYEKNTEKKDFTVNIEHSVYYFLLSILDKQVPTVIIVISNLKRMRFIRSPGPKESTPGILPKSYPKGQVRSQC